MYTEIKEKRKWVKRKMGNKNSKVNVDTGNMVVRE